MENVIVKQEEKLKIKSIIFNISTLVVIFFTPTVSHLLNIPLYLFEPMRIMLILSIAHTNKLNAYILAITLPLFSFVVSGHPIFPKVAIVAFELLLNVWLFYTLKQKIRNTFFAMSISIILSKAVYYLIKFALVSWLLFDSEIISTPIYIQGITVLMLSIYLFIVSKKQNTNYIN